MYNPFVFLEAKCPGKIGLPPVQILGHESMKPFQYSQLLKAKPKKLNKDEKEFQNNEYVPLYTFSMPAKVNIIVQPEPVYCLVSTSTLHNMNQYV